MRPMRNLSARQRQAAHSLVEVIVAIFVLGILVVSLLAAFSSGMAIVELSRENLRATQIMIQKMESIRLYTWSQVTTSNSLIAPTFSDYYDPSGASSNSGGVKYAGFVGTNAAPGVAPAYAGRMRQVSVTVFWTNYPYGNKNNPITRSRSMQTFVTRYGLQDYISQ